MSKIIVVSGLSNGDEGKGTIVEYETIIHDARAVVRYGGGPQAVHNVVLPNGTSHCFAQYGSGTFHNEVETFLTHHMVVDPLRLVSEAAALELKGIQSPLQRVLIDSKCAVVTPLHMIINQMRELSRGDDRHGSCGIGVGEAIMDRKYFGDQLLVVEDLCKKDVLANKLHHLWLMKCDIAEQICDEHPESDSIKKLFGKISDVQYLSLIAEELYAFGKNAEVHVAENIFSHALQSSETIILEGSQGALLDVDWGFAPHVTKSPVTTRNAGQLIKQHCPQADVVSVGVLRAYATRHGAGPFVSEDQMLTASLPDMCNSLNQWQGAFRVGWFDLVATRYALSVSGGIDQIALTNIDRLQSLSSVNVCNAYRLMKEIDPCEFDQFFEGERYGSGWIIHRIKKTSEPNVRHQQRLTQLLAACNPCYLQFGPVYSLRTQEYYIQFIERELGVPISIVSRGPTHADKYQR